MGTETQCPVADWAQNSSRLTIRHNTLFDGDNKVSVSRQLQKMGRTLKEAAFSKHALPQLSEQLEIKTLNQGV